MAYSRLQSVEEKRNVRSAILFIFLTLAAIALLFFYGVPAMGRFAAFVSDIGKSGKPITTNDHTPPAPPRFDYVNNFTNQQNAGVSGVTEAGATIKLTFNGNEQNTLADKDGKFQFNLQLNSGANIYSAVAVDTAGNISQKTQDYTITYDNKPPALTIASPSDGSQFFGSTQRQVTIKGTTDPNDQVTINDRIVAVDDNGNYQYTLSLSDGDNKFAVKATDQAGNNTEKDITLTFTP